MKMAVVLLLLCVFLTAFADDPETPSVPAKVKPDLCDGDMACFVPGECVGADTKEFHFLNNEINSNCKAILKIRPYTAAKWLIVLESLEENVKSLALEQGTTKLSCANVDSKVTAEYAGNPISELLSENVSPLKCEFVARGERKVMPGTAAVQLSADNFAVTMIAAIFDAFTLPTCDDDAISSKVTDGVDGDKRVTQVIGKYRKLECQTKYNLEYHYDGETEYKDASSIACAHNKETQTKFYVTDNYPNKAVKSVRCTIPLCSLCTFNSSTHSEKSPTIVDSGSCKNLTCPNDYGLQIDRADPIGSPAQCVYKGDKHVWSLGKMTFDSTNKVTCVPKVIDCMKSDFQALCDKDLPDGYIKCNATERGPHCNNGDLQLDGNLGKLNCTKYIGFIFDGKPVKEGSLLSCGKEAASSEQTGTAGLDMGEIGGIIGGVLLVALIAGIVAFVLLRKKKKDVDQRQPETLQTATSKKAQNKSKKGTVVESKAEPLPDVPTTPPPPQASPMTTPCTNAAKVATPAAAASTETAAKHGDERMRVLDSDNVPSDWGKQVPQPEWKPPCNAGVAKPSIAFSQGGTSKNISDPRNFKDHPPTIPANVEVADPSSEHTGAYLEDPFEDKKVAKIPAC